MSQDELNKLLKAVGKVKTPGLRLSERVEVTAKVPVGRAVVEQSIKTVADEVSLTFKADKTTTLSLDRKGKTTGVKFTKKF